MIRACSGELCRSPCSLSCPEHSEAASVSDLLSWPLSFSINDGSKRYLRSLSADGISGIRSDGWCRLREQPFKILFLFVRHDFRRLLFVPYQCRKMICLDLLGRHAAVLDHGRCVCIGDRKISIDRWSATLNDFFNISNGRKKVHKESKS